MNRKWLLFTVVLSFGFSCKRDVSKPAYPTEGLISYFGFNNTILDKQNYATMGTAKYTFGTGKIGKCVTLNGVDEVLEFIPLVPTDHSKISISVWIKTNESGSTKYFIGGNGFGLATSLGKVSMIISNPITDAAISNSITANQWTHVVGTYDGVNIQIYINGSWLASKNHPGSISGFNSSLFLGLVNGKYWAGSIDELYFYNRALSQAEVTQLYQLK